MNKAHKKDFLLRYEERYREQCKKDQKELEDLSYFQCDKQLGLSKQFDSFGMGPMEGLDILREKLGIHSFAELPGALQEIKTPHRANYSRDNSYVESEKGNPLTLKLWTLLATENLIQKEREDRVYVGNEALEELLSRSKSLFNVNNSAMMAANMQFFAENINIM